MQKPNERQGRHYAAHDSGRAAEISVPHHRCHLFFLFDVLAVPCSTFQLAIRSGDHASGRATLILSKLMDKLTSIFLSNHLFGKWKHRPTASTWRRSLLRPLTSLLSFVNSTNWPSANFKAWMYLSRLSWHASLGAVICFRSSSVWFPTVGFIAKASICVCVCVCVFFCEETQWKNKMHWRIVEWNEKKLWSIAERQSKYPNVR